MTSYGKKMLYAALGQKDKPRVPKEQLSNKMKVKRWLNVSFNAKQSKVELTPKLPDASLDNQTLLDNDYEQLDLVNQQPSLQSKVELTPKLPDASLDHHMVPDNDYEQLDLENQQPALQSQVAATTNLPEASLDHRMLSDNEELDSENQQHPLDVDRISDSYTSDDSSDILPVLNASGSSKPISSKSVAIKKPKRPCAYCGKMQAQLVRHIKRAHKDKDEVKQALKLPKSEQSRTFSQIRKAGIYQENLKLSAQGKELMRERNQGSKDVVMCVACRGFYSRRKISKHKKKCKVDSVQNTGWVAFERRAEQPEFSTKILKKFRNDEVGKLCRTDFVCLRLGKKLWEKSVRKDSKVIRNDMRSYANLIMEVRKVANDDGIGGEDIITRKYFDQLTEAINNLAKKEDSEITIKAGLKVTMGYTLKKVIHIMKGYYAQVDDNVKEQECERFKNVLDLNWDYIFYRAQLTCEQRRHSLRKPQDMPLEGDLAAFKTFITHEMKELVSDEYKKWDAHDFVFMRNLLVARLTMFNARRGGEPVRMLLQEWEDAEKMVWVDKNLIEKIDDPIEKELADDLKLAYQLGKGGRKLVPVLFPKDTILPVRKLISERSECGVARINVYLFPSTGDSEEHATGWNCIQHVAKLMGDSLERPDLLIADKFRHRASTLYALLDVPAERRHVFYRHMGHSEAINRDVYQCPLAVSEITQVGQFLDKIDTFSSQNSAACEPTDTIDIPYGGAADALDDNQTDKQVTSEVINIVKSASQTETAKQCRERGRNVAAIKKSASSTDSKQINQRRKGYARQKTVSLESSSTSSPVEEVQIQKRLRRKNIVTSKSRHKTASSESSFVCSESEFSYSSSSIETVTKQKACGRKNIVTSESPGISRSTKPCKKQKQRRYISWSASDAELVKTYFEEYINDSNRGATGSLPGKKLLIEFLQKHSVFEHLSLTEEDKISLVKTKVFNDRQKKRNTKRFDSV